MASRRVHPTHRRAGVGVAGGACGEAVKRKPHDLDVCDCGDARRDHENGTGACRFRTHGGIPSREPESRCNKFRLFEKAKDNSE